MYTSAELQLLRETDPGAILPGIDTPAGNPDPAASLLNYTAITQARTAPYYYDAALNEVIVTQAGAVLSGINFGTAGVDIEANGVTIKDCTFTGTSGWWAIDQSTPYTNATVEDCSFTGSKASTEVGAFIVSANNITIENNSFIDTPADAIHLEQGTVSGNYFSGGGYQDGAHADAIWVYGSSGPTNITDNFIDWTNNSDAAVATNNAIRITNEVGLDVNDVNVSNNYLLGGSYTVAVEDSPENTISNVSITDNYIGFGVDGAYYPGNASSPSTEALATMSGNTIIDFTNPIYSTDAQAAYTAPTKNVVTATGATDNIISTAAGPTTLFGDGYKITMSGSTSETNYVGGFGRQYIYGGDGANIFTYLAVSDSTPNDADLIKNFDPAKDVIDLSAIDADLTTAGVQNFTFIGTAPFSGDGGQVRYQQNPTTGLTYVEADLVGDSTPDLEIELNGLMTLSGLNFALTAAKSSTDLANGAALADTESRAGTSAEYSYTNVKGQAYSTFEALYSSSTDRAADDLNLSSTANDLVLYDNNMTITRGGGSETVQLKTGTPSLAYHSTETIDASAAGAEQFVFETNFGAETINGLATSGANADTIQLPTAAFSYLTTGMTQAQDLAAVLAKATGSAIGLTIADSHGDSLTVAGMTAATLAASPSVFHFA